MTADRITALEEALRPFAFAGAGYDDVPDDAVIYIQRAYNSEIFSEITMRDLRRAALAASRAAPDCHQPDLVAAAQVRIKPLVWGPYPNSVFAGPDVSVANVSGAVISYYYQAGRDPDAPGYYVFAAPTHGVMQWRSNGHSSIEAAKAAVQADYEARILAALDLTPAPAVEPRTVIGGDASVAVCQICDIAGCKHVRGEAPAVEPVARRTFPILGSNGARIDYQLVVDHGGQAKENHYQTVDRLAERGGLSWCELHAVLNNRKYTKIDQNTAIKECRAIEAEYLASIAPTAQDAARVPEIAALTDSQVASACMSYRHDFGLLNASDRAALMWQAREWLRAWQKELPALRDIGGDA